MPANPAVRKSLLSRMVILVLGSTVLCFLGMMVLVLLEAQSEILTDLREESQALADSYTDGMGREFLRFAHLAGAVARGLEIMPDPSLPQAGSVLQAVLLHFQEIEAVHLDVAPGPGRRRVAIGFRRSGNSVRPLAENEVTAWDGGDFRPRWGPIHEAEGFRVFTCMVPFHRKGEVVGALSLDLGVAHLARDLKLLKVGKTGYAVMIGPDGSLAVGPESGLVSSETWDRATPIATTRAGVALIQDPVHRRPAWMLVDRVPGTPISLALVYPAHEVMAPAWRLTWKLSLLTLAGLLMLALVVVHISRSIVRPITALASAVRQVAAGDLNRELPPPSSEDEVGQLEEAFSQMLQDLRRHIEELTRTTAAKERMETELTIARDLQHSILPRIVPSFRDELRIDLAARCTPAREVGGDFYDFFALGQEHFGFVLADVSDKGMAAALFASLTQALGRSLASSDEAPGDCLTRVNRLLTARNERLMFVTLFYGILNTRTGRIRYANAGHNPPYLVRAGKVTPVAEQSGMALGVCADETYQTFEMALAPGEGLMIYSDGVTEAMDMEGRLFSEERLEAVLEQTGLTPASSAVEQVVEEVERFSQGAGQSDDMTLLALRYLGRATEGPSPRLVLNLRGVLEELPRVHRELGEFAALHGVPDSVLHDVHVALEEVLTNLVTYGSGEGKAPTLDVQAVLEGQVLRLVVEDDTPNFDPLEVEAPDVTAELADRPIGGLGLLLVRELMDSVQYEQREGRNRLTLTRRLEGG